MQEIGHPSYQRLNDHAIRRKAQHLPHNGVPPELLKVIHSVDEANDKLQPQKAAAPVDAMVPPEQVGSSFAAQRPRGVVAEGESTDRKDANAIAVSALNDMVQSACRKGGDRSSVPTIEVRTGNVMLDQFQPLYFAVAFVFCFKYCTACPDIMKAMQTEMVGDRRHIAEPNAPNVNIHEWAGAMMRRVETQFRRDWTFGFVAWNYIFRTMVNLQKNTYMFSTYNDDGGKRALTNEEIRNGVRDLYKGLTGTYVDINGKNQPVNGDLAKLKHVPTLSAAARTLLANTEARSRNIPGTHEVRKTMRRQTHSYRVSYGTSIFVTFSPSERDSVIMLRLMRARACDPSLTSAAEKFYQQRTKPDLETDYCELSVEEPMH